MLITRDGEIAGLPAVQARDLMKSIRQYAVSLGELTQLLDTSTEEARAVVQRLEEQGYLSRVEPFTRCNVLFNRDEVASGATPEDLEYWATTVTGKHSRKSTDRAADAQTGGRPASRRADRSCGGHER